jgi:hypothetical protein
MSRKAILLYLPGTRRCIIKLLPGVMELLPVSPAGGVLIRIGKMEKSFKNVPMFAYHSYY